MLTFLFIRKVVMQVDLAINGLQNTVVKHDVNNCWLGWFCVLYMLLLLLYNAVHFLNFGGFFFNGLSKDDCYLVATFFSHHNHMCQGVKSNE